MSTAACFRLLASILVGVAACSPTEQKQIDTASDRAAITKIDHAHATAYVSGDIDSIAAEFAEDAVLMPPDAPTVTGRDGIRKYFAMGMANVKPGESESFDDYVVEVSGDVGWSAGHSKVTGPEGSTVWSGKFIGIWRKKNNRWLATRQIWTNDPVASTR